MSVKPPGEPHRGLATNVERMPRADSSDLEERLRRSVEVAARELATAAELVRRHIEGLPWRQRQLAVSLSGVADRLDFAAQALSRELMLGPDPHAVRGLSRYARRAWFVLGAVGLSVGAGVAESAGDEIWAEIRGRLATANAGLDEVDDAARQWESDFDPSQDSKGMEDEELDGGRFSGETGWSGTKVAKIVGISYRQLDYWARTDLIRPSIAVNGASGSRRLYTYRDILELKVIKSLLDAGMKLEVVRIAFDMLRSESTLDDRKHIVITGGEVKIVDEAHLSEALRTVSAGAVNILSLAAVKKSVDDLLTDEV